MTRARFNLAFAFIATTCLAVAGLQAGGGQQQNFDNVEAHLQKAQGNVYMLVGAGGNVTVQIGKEGVLIVDTQYAPLSNKILAAVRTLSQGPLRATSSTRTATPITSAATRT